MSKIDRTEYLVMGILKNPLFDKYCNSNREYAGFVRTILNGVTSYMKSKGKNVLWTFPIENMAKILKKLYGPVDNVKSKEIVSSFLDAIDLNIQEKDSILFHPSGLFVIHT